MNKVFLIILREYFTRVKNKTFIVTTLLIPIFFGGFIVSMIYLTKFLQEKQHLICLDETNLFTNKIADTEHLYIKFTDTSLTYLKEHYKEMGYEGLLYIPKFDLNRPTGITIYSENHIGLQTKQYIERSLENKIERIRLIDAGLEEHLLDDIKPKINLNTIITKGDKDQLGDTRLITTLGMLMGFLIYMILMIYGTLVMKGVMEEKTNRIAEVIISSVKPFQLMLGKVIGIAAVGLTQFLLWGVLIFFIQLFIGISMGDEILNLQQATSGQAIINQDTEDFATLYMSIQEINFTQIGFMFIIYFIGGYLLYASLFAAVGSVVDDQSDSQSLVFPITIPIIISMFIMMTISNDPNNTLVKWASIIPLSSPIVMPARIPFGVPTIELIASIVCLILGFVFTIWLAGKIYRTGILLYGKKVTIKEIGRWIAYKQ